MLKFLRKYNVAIMVVAGSLLMVMFLLEPVLTRLGPNPMKQKIGVLSTTGKSVSRADLMDSAGDLQIIERFVPWITSPAILGLDTNRDDLHFHLLLEEARLAGLVGEADDGFNWLPELARQTATQSMFAQFQQQGFPRQFWGMLLQNNQAQLDQTTQELMTRYPELRVQLATSLRTQPERIDLALAHARGILRHRNSFNLALRISEPQTIDAAREFGDAALADLLVLPADLFLDQIAEPTVSELRAQYEQYKDAAPEPPTPGYLRDPSVKIAWLVLRPSVFREAARVDPVEVRKRWSQDRTRYAGEFADERAAIEAELRAAEGERLMVEADQIIQREITGRLRRLEQNDDGTYILPGDWTQTRPSLPALARIIGDELTERVGSRVPMPQTEVRNAAWLDANALNTIPDLARAQFRAGAAVTPVSNLPILASGGADSPVLAQVQVPIVETPALLPDGSRVYITVLDARPESAPDNLDEVMDLVRNDLRRQRAYDALLSEKDVYLQLAADESLEAVVNLFAPDPDAGIPTTPPPAPVLDALVTRSNARSLTNSGQMDPEFMIEDILGAIVDASSDLDPTDPFLEDPDPILIESPIANGLVIAKVRGARQMPIEDFRRQAPRLAQDRATVLIADRIIELQNSMPFSLQAVASRLGWTPKDEEDAASPPPAEEATATDAEALTATDADA